MGFIRPSSATSGVEVIANKVSLSANATNTQYPTAKSVWDCMQDVMATLPAGGLHVPINVDTESGATGKGLPDVSTRTVGDYFFIQNMDISCPEHTGRAWVNYSDPDDTTSPLAYYKVFDQYQSMDGATIVQTGGGEWQVSAEWLTGVIYMELLGHNTDPAAHADIRAGIRGAGLKGSPHLWDVGREIDFGDGSFGVRMTGILTASASSGLNTELFSFGTNYANGGLVLYGGWWKFDAANSSRIGLGEVRSTGSAYYAAAVSFQQTAIRLYTYSTSARSSAPYDVWVIYTKA